MTSRPHVIFKHPWRQTVNQLGLALHKSEKKAMTPWEDLTLAKLTTVTPWNDLT